MADKEIKTETPTLDAATEALLSDEAVSSQATGLEELLTKSAEAVSGGIEAAKAGQEAGEASILGTFGREIFETTRLGDIKAIDVTETRRGFATNTAILQNIRVSTEKKVNDMEQRKQELLLQNDAQAAAQISQLQFQALQFEQNATQQVFQNLLSMSGLGLQRRAESRADKALALQERAQGFAEKQAYNSVALEFGITPVEGETFDELIVRAAPVAGQDRMQELALRSAQIRQANANAAKIERGLEATFDQNTIDVLASTFLERMSNGDLTGAQNIEDGIVEQEGEGGRTKFLKSINAAKAVMFSEENLRADIIDDLDNQVGEGKIISDINDNLIMNLKEKARAIRITREEADKRETRTTLPSILERLGRGRERISKGTLEFLTGNKMTDKEFKEFFKALRIQ